MKEGFSVLIPERGRPDLLQATVTALQAALAKLEDVPFETLVCVNGADPWHYDDLRSAFPWIEWLFWPTPMGYHGAITYLLEHARHPWVYLLNSDMCLEPDALSMLLPWREPRLFAIASQLHFADVSRRREETGYTQPVIDESGQLQLHDLLPPDKTVRAHLYAGGGASLFQSEALLRYCMLSNAYAPFYFEDADWGMQAWAEGLKILFCPTSHAVHEHRATISRYFAESEIELICNRNLTYFRWRYADFFGASRVGDASGSDLSLRRLLHTWRHEHAMARSAVELSPFKPEFRELGWKRFPKPVRPDKPTVLMVSPFRIIPPGHGGARRVLELARAIASEINWVLLHDEAGDSPLTSWPDHDAAFCQIQPVRGRPEHGDDPLDRLRAHAHEALVNEMRRLLQQSGAQAVCLEHLESLFLIDALPQGVPVILTLHDAHRQAPLAIVQALKERMHRVTTLVLTTPQDIGFWGHPNELIIENGVTLPPSADPTPDDLEVLIVAPLRYDRNLLGLRDFLREAWPTVRALIPKARLTVLGGIDTFRHLHELPNVMGVEIIDGYVDPGPYYARCSLAANPQRNIEGSALKVAEALAHGRVMVTTLDGARGYEALESVALCRVDGWTEMAETIAELLTDPAKRRDMEKRGRVDIKPWSWNTRSGKLLVELNKLTRP